MRANATGIPARNVFSDEMCSRLILRGARRRYIFFRDWS